MKKLFFYFLVIFIIPITIILWIFLGITVSAETLRLFKSDKVEKYNPEICYRSACIKGYENYDWANKFFYENKNLKFIFSDFTLWKAKNYKGETINILHPENIRKTFKPKEFKNDKKAYFFGGSVAWGFGSSDDLTLPSLFAKKYNIETFNYAQQAWVSSQNLTELSRIISAQKKIDYVFFIDGINDSRDLCSTNQNENHFVSSVRNIYQEKVYSNQNSSNISYDNILNTFKSFITFLKYRFIDDYHFKRLQKNFKETKYDCHKNRIKKENATNFVIGNWMQAKTLTEKAGGKFFLILQPNIYFDQTKSDHFLSLHKTHEKNISLKDSEIAFYNEIIKKIGNEDFFIDTKDIFRDKYDYIHIDYGSHFLPKGYENVLEVIGSKYEF